MTITELLDEFRRLGVHLGAKNDKLVVDAPAGVLTAAHAAAIRENKAELLELFAEVSEAAADDDFELSRAPGECRLSLTQERIWAIDQLSPGNGQFNLPGSWWLNGRLDPDRFERALSHLIEAHQIFKRRFTTENGKAAVTEPLHTGVDFRQQSVEDIPGTGDVEHDLPNWLADLSREPFDLANEPLLRVFLVAVNSERHYLAMISHAAIWDGWCYDLFLNELGRLYEQDASDSTEPGYQYSDYVRWQRDRQDSDAVVTSLEREASRLKEVQHRVNLPLDFPNPDPADHSGARFNFYLPSDLRQHVKRASRQTGATPFMILLTAYATLLCRYSNQDTILITVPLRGREKGQFEKIFGPFTNNLFLRVDTRKHSFSSLLETVKTDVGNAFGREIVPFERIIEVLNQDLAASAFFQLQFSFQNVEDRNPDWATGITLTTGPQRDFHVTHSDIGFWLREGRDLIDGAIDYRTAQFGEDSIETFYKRFLSLIEVGLKFPDTPLRDLFDGTDELSLHVNNDVQEFDALNELSTALKSQADSPVVLFPNGRQLTASHLLSVLAESGNDLATLVSALSKSSASQVATVDTAKVDRAVAAWCSRFSDNDRRVLVVDAKPGLSTIVAWLSAIIAGRMLCIAVGNFAADEISVLGLIRDLEPDVVALSSPQMQSLLDMENLPVSPRFIVRAFSGGGAIVDKCKDNGIELDLVLGDDSTLGVGLIGSGNGWPHCLERIEPGVSVTILDSAGHPQLFGIDGALALSLGSESPQQLDPVVTVRQNASGQFCWPDVDSNPNRELNAVQSALLSYAEVDDAYVSYRRADAQSKQAIAWVVQKQEIEVTATTLRARLDSEGLGAPLIINIDHIPRGREGQVLVRDLIHPDVAAVYAGFEPPSTDREKQFAAIWSQTLELERIGANDNFANLGGNSVQALVVLSETQKQLGWSFEPRLLFFQSLRQIVERAPA